MNSNPVTETKRLVFLDNLRALLVLLVLVFHAGASYGTLVGFWPYHDPNPREWVDLIMILLDTFMMSILFFIAGFFCLPSLRKRDGGRFVTDKLKRLGLPWLAVTALVLPVLDYVHYCARSVAAGLEPRGYAAHWWRSMLAIARLDTGPMHMSAYLDMTEHFYQRYMWFLSLLLLFFILAWLGYQPTQTWGRATARPEPRAAPTNRSIAIAMVTVGFLTVLLFAPVYLTVSRNPIKIAGSWFSLGNLIQFQPAKLVFYVAYFGLGLYASAQNWFADGAAIGRLWVWGTIWVMLMVGSMLAARNITHAAEAPLGLHLAFAVLYPLWTLSFLGLFVALAHRHWNRATPLGRELSTHSYNLYLVHYVFVMTLPPLLGRWVAGPTIAKFGIVALLTIALSYTFSKVALKPHPRLVALGLIATSVLLAVLT